MSHRDSHRIFFIQHDPLRSSFHSQALVTSTFNLVVLIFSLRGTIIWIFTLLLPKLERAFLVDDDAIIVSVPANATLHGSSDEPRKLVRPSGSHEVARPSEPFSAPSGLSGPSAPSTFIRRRHFWTEQSMRDLCASNEALRAANAQLRETLLRVCRLVPGADQIGADLAAAAASTPALGSDSGSGTSFGSVGSAGNGGGPLKYAAFDDGDTKVSVEMSAL